MGCRNKYNFVITSNSKAIMEHYDILIIELKIENENLWEIASLEKKMKNYFCWRKEGQLNGPGINLRVPCT